jgi:hypothetical protein
MSKDIQHFIFHLKPSASSAHPCIRLNAEVVHVIDDLNEFYAQIGFDKQRVRLCQKRTLWKNLFSQA